MEPKEFNDCFMQAGFEKLSYKNKYVVLIRGFHIDILKYDSNGDSKNLIDKMYTNFPLSYITSPSPVRQFAS